MQKTKLTIILFALVVIGLTAYKQNHKTEIREDFKKYYDQFKVEGSFVLYDQNNDKYIYYNPSQRNVAYTPASTFKICNSLIGIETGVIKDENFVVSWDHITRQIPAWNQDQDLKTAFKNSTVWYYQELARRVGGKQIKYWLDKAKYGNADTSGGIDKFWLSGGLRITPLQQINFLKRLYENKLPFSLKSIEIVKKIMIAKDTLGYILRAKTGWGGQDKRDIGWYVGYLEAKNNVYYFANCIQTSDLSNMNFAEARKEITYKILYKLTDIKIK